MIALLSLAPLLDVGVEHDWTRFLWDMTRDGVLFADVLDAYGAAQPQSWSNTVALPAFRHQLETVKGYSQWADHDYLNGVDL